MADLTAYNFDVYRGEMVTISFQVTPPRNINGETHKFTLAKKQNLATKLVGPSAVSWDDATQGAGHFALTSAQMNLTPGTYYWDVWRTDSGFEICEAIGTITILPEVRVPEA